MLVVLMLYLHGVHYISGQDCSVLSDPRVFDPIFYLNNHPDLKDAGINSPEGAVEHWCSNGIDEGRQATSMFHSVQYLDRYPDIEEEYPGDWRGAINHYIVHGYDAGRIGYIEGGAYGRWTVRSTNPVTEQHYVYISTSDRVAGAIDSLVWKNKEFINSYDHGRQLQLALAVPPYGECWNPTEAGGRADGVGSDTHSVIQNISAVNNIMQTTNHPAYWFLPNTTSTIDGASKCQTGDPAHNELPTHPFDMSKTVTIGCFGLDNCIQFDIDVNMGSGYGMPTDFDMGKLEAPAAYLMADFSFAKRWNYETGQIMEATEGEGTWPVIIHNAEETYALGGYTVPHETLRHFNITGFDNGTYKWSIVLRDRSKKPGDRFILSSWVCVGDLDMVVNCLNTVRNQTIGLV